MSETTGIAWADSTFNPWIGCTKIGPGCNHCYASVSTPARTLGVEWGAGKPRHRTSASSWAKPLAWNKRAAESGKPWRVFCASLADVFDNEVPREWRRDLWDLIYVTPHLTWMLLTKRIGNAVHMLPGGWYAQPDHEGRGPLPTVWIGATVVNQEEADRDIPKLLAVPAAVRFLSIEPMLGPIEFSNVTKRSDAVHQLGKKALDGISWVIVGGESDQPGHRARPFDIAWARDIVRQCRAANVPVFVKQLGSRARWPDLPPASWAPLRYGLVLKDRAGADPAEWPHDLRVQEWPR